MMTNLALDFHSVSSMMILILRTDDICNGKQVLSVTDITNDKQIVPVGFYYSNLLTLGSTCDGAS